MKNIENIAKQIHEILHYCTFDNVSDSSGCFIIKEFEDGTERYVDVYKSTNDGNPHYVIYCKYEDEDFDYKYTNTISLQELKNILEEFYMEENHMNINKILPNELLPVFEKIAKEMELDFKNGFLDDVFETDYCITRTDLPECSKDEIEICKMDWIHSIKEDFLHGVIQELHPNEINSDNSEKYYETYYNDCFDYLINKTFEVQNQKINEFDTVEGRTKNFEDFQNAMKNLSIMHLVKLIDYINKLSTFIPSNNDILSDFSDVVEPIVEVIDNCKTDKKCPHCGRYLFKSDLPQYDYVCVECDENFDEWDVK